MPAKYDQLRTLAFRLNPEIGELPHRCHALVFPEQWKEPLRALHASINKRQIGKTTVPIFGLNRALRALVPDLLTIERGAGKGGERPWLYSAREIEPKALLPIIHAWVHAAYGKASDTARAQLLREFKASDLQWRTDEQLDLATWSTGTYGTADPGRGDYFSLLPDKLASILSHADVDLEFGPHHLRFRRAPMPLGQSGAELVSWPPMPHEKKKKVWYYSIVITLTAQTVPYQDFPVIHCDLGIRRWAGHGNQPAGGNTSVYLLTDVPWLRGMHETSSFHVASLRWQPVGDEHVGKKDFRLVWGDYLVEMLNRLHPQRPFPDPELLRTDPIQALNLDGSPTAAVVYSTRFSSDHPVGPGLMPQDRRLLAEQIGALFEPSLLFTDAPLKATYKKTGAAAKNPFFAATEDKVKKDGSTQTIDPAQRDAALVQRRAIVSQATGGRLNIEIWHDTGAVRDALVGAVCDLFGLPAPQGSSQQWATPELEIQLTAQAVGKLATNLSLDSEISNTRDRLRAALNARINEIAAATDETVTETVALIEIAGKSAYEKRQLEDPKQAIRIGFGRRGRLNQHITPDDPEKLEHKAKHALLDAIRQLGVQNELPQIMGLPKPIQVVGVWLIKGTSGPNKSDVQIPVFVAMSSDSSVIRATAPGLNDTWLPYGQAMLAIADGEAHGFNGAQRVCNYIKETLAGDILAQGDTLLLCHAQNLRQTWPWLQNRRISRDSIAFGYDDAPRPISSWPGLRVVRVRSKAPFETPEWYAVNDADEHGFAKGLFGMGERVFASTYGKPHQFATLSRNLSKADVWGPNSGDTRDPRPDAHAWNPGLFELTVACLQPNDTASPWAALTHELRNQALHYDEATALPLPLHLGQLMEEYVVDTDDSEEEE